MFTLFTKKKGTSVEKIKLGDKVRCKLTGCEGTVIAITEWLNQCRRMSIQPSHLKDGVPVDPTTLDEVQLEILSAGPPTTPKKTGGPRPEPRRNPDPTR
jgi:hypothetical protein